jgi:hypothetical protein
MKNFIKTHVILLCFLHVGCQENQPKTEAQASRSNSSAADTIGTVRIDTIKDREFDNLADFIHLSPIELVNAEGNNAYEKYGIEFSGNCYTCDLAAISVNKKSFDLINVCDNNDFYRTENFTYLSSPNEFVVNTEKNKFIFTKIDEAPVYELKILGEKINLKNKRISTFYTPQKALKNFKRHDCGEFEG